MICDVLRRASAEIAAAAALMLMFACTSHSACKVARASVHGAVIKCVARVIGDYVREACSVRYIL